MPLIVTRSPHTRQPQGAGARVASEAIAAGLAHLWVPGASRGRDLVGQWHLTPSGAGATVGASAKGATYATNGVANFAISAGPVTLPTTFLWVGMVRCRADSTISFLGPSGNAYNDGGYVLGRWSTNTDFYFADGSGAFVSWSTSAYTTGDWALFAVQFVEGSSIPRLWINGSNLGNATGATVGAITARRLAGVTGFDPDTETALSALWAGPQPDSYVSRVMRDPWHALFAPIERRIWVPSAGGSSVPNITAVYADSVTASSVVPRVTLDYA